MRTPTTTNFIHALRATALAAGLALVAAPVARAENVTPQAANADAAFLAYPATPAPPTPTKVCVVDTGVDLDTDVARNVAERYSMFGGTLDDVGVTGIPKHGTYVAGIIASGLNDGGSVGIWPQAKIISVRVFAQGNSSSSTATYIQALTICQDRGAKVINLSLSGLGDATGTDLTELDNRITDLRVNENIDVVAAAGNSGGEVGYPGRFPASFTVGASNADRNFCSFSSRGPELDISAFGCGLYVSMAGGGMGVGEGTSFSAPIVSAALAALRAYSPGLTAVAAENLLTSTARTAGAGKVLDVAAAFHAVGLDRIITTPVPPRAVPAAPTPSEGPTTVVDTPSTVASAPVADPLAELGVHKPRVRGCTYRRGLLSVVVSGVPDFGRAIFTVDGRRYARPSGKLRLRLKRAPKNVAALIDVPDVGRTAAVRVTVKGATHRSVRGNARR